MTEEPKPKTFSFSRMKINQCIFTLENYLCIIMHLLTPNYENLLKYAQDSISF